MGLIKAQFNPGIDKQTTTYGAEGGWIDSKNVRFRTQMPEKIGGWETVVTDTIVGVVRGSLAWLSLEGTKHLALGTDRKLYVYIEGRFYDITPIRLEAALNGPFAMVSGSPVVTVTHTSHGGSEGDFVTYDSFSTAQGLDMNAEFEVTEIPEDLKESANKYRQELVETAVEQDEKLMEDYLNGKEILEKDLIKCIRKGCLKFDFVPVLTGSAFKNKGVQPLLDAVVDYLPSPIDIGSIKGTKPNSKDEIERKFDDKAPFSALAFKVATDPFVGTLTFIRIYSGSLKAATGIYNTSRDKEERVGRMLLMHANSREDVKEANTGDIVALAGLKYTITGHTLCDENDPVILEPMEFPDPVIEIAVEPKTKADQEKMGEALARLAKEDPSFRVTSDDESGQTVIKGMGELHLDIIVDRMKREFKVEANVGAPQVAYRETISKEVEVTYTHKKQSGGAGQFAEVKIIVEGCEPGTGRLFEDKIKGGNIPKEYIPGVEKGIEGVADTGVIAGFPIIDYKVTLIDGKYHDVDSSSLAFEIAGRMAFKDACQKAGPKLLEPVMRVEVVTPEEFMGDVIGDLSSRRGQVSGSEARGNTTAISSMVPLANMFGYVNTLRSMTQGRAQYSMFFDHYEQVPQNVQDEVKAKFA